VHAIRLRVYNVVPEDKIVGGERTDGNRTVLISQILRIFLNDGMLLHELSRLYKQGASLLLLTIAMPRQAHVWGKFPFNA
jgi:hypothetical protein